jgi:serine/threonine-protein kinase
MARRDEAERVEARVSRASRDPLVGTVINGKFHVERAIARGGMGRIYYATQAPLGRPVALKIVKADTVNEEESQYLKRFLLEASILAKLQHPNVVTLFDYGRIEGAAVEMSFIAMEYLNGETLADRLRARGTLPAFEALTLFRQIARGLREAHTRGIVHRDLKPSNIVIVPEADGEIVKLVDFGIGKDERGDDDLTREGVLVGTPRYMAPEQFDGVSSPASDVYALGTIVYQALTGMIPFAGASMADLMIAKLQHPIPPIREVNPICDATDALESLVYDLLARRAADRPTIDELFTRLSLCEEEIFSASGSRFALVSGSRPRLGYPVSSSPQSIRAMQSADTAMTQTAPAPWESSPRALLTGDLATDPASAAASGQLPTMTGLTPRPMAPEPPPVAPAPATTARAFGLVRLALALSLVAAALWLARTWLPGKEDASTGTAAPIPSARVPTAVVTSTASSMLPPPAFVLHLDSAPSGAAVIENGNVLGVTPLNISVDRMSVSDGRTRAFQLKKEGYAATVFAQGIAESDVKQTVALSPVPAHTAKSPNAGKSSRAAPDPSGESDIRLKR